MISITPPIRTGPSQAYRNSFQKTSSSWWRRYSNHITEHVPPYITRWVHLSMNATSLSGVSGTTRRSERNQTSAKQNSVKG